MNLGFSDRTIEKVRIISLEFKCLALGAGSLLPQALIRVGRGKRGRADGLGDSSVMIRKYRSESGNICSEYAVIIAVLAVALIGPLHNVKNNIEGIFLTV